MSTACSNLHPFIDDELDEAAATAFRAHLGDCATCPAELEAAVMVDVVAQGALLGAAAGPRTMEVPNAPANTTATTLDATPGRRTRSRWARAVPAAVTIFAAAALLFWVRADRGDHAGPLAMLIADESRSVEARLSYPGLDRHRPLRRERGGGTRPWIEGREQTLAELEERGDHHGLAVASLLEGRFAESKEHFDRAPQSPAVLNDAAALAIERGDAAAAVALARRALVLDPGRAPALWNLAVALHLQGAADEAIAAFQAVVALGEPGWSDEARARAAALAARPR